MTKRVVDVIGAIFGLLVFLPIMVGVALTIYWSMGGAVLFCQMRPGLGGKPFRLIKFRSMRSEFDASGRRLDEGERITSVGRFLRATSLDELPELWNVLVGDMSLVGPRPLLVQYLPLYTPEQARRHEVRPGITGWAQVNGRNSLTWEEKFKLDVWYVDNRSLLLDAKIFAATLLKVVRRADINAAGAATMPLFTGTSAEKH